MEAAGMPGADWVTKLVTVGPPCLLVLGLLIILQAAAREKIDIKKTSVMSGIVAVFFVLWIVALPKLQTRRIAIVTTMPPAELLRGYSLHAIRYHVEPAGALKDADLDSIDFDFPHGADQVKLVLDLEGLIESYKSNLEAVIKVAQNDPQCFDQATRGHAYSEVAAQIRDKCPATLLLASSASAEGPR